MKKQLQNWWRNTHSKVRKPVVFIVGITLIALSPVVGSIPGPGGIALFIFAIGILGSEFDWALQLKDFFLKTVPREVKNRWRLTPAWQNWFDFFALTLLIAAIWLALQAYWFPVISFSAAGLCLALFNRDRLSRIQSRLRSNKS